MYVPEGLECRGRKRQVWEVVVSRRNSSCTAKEMHPAASGRSSTYSVLLESLRPTTYSWSHKEVGQLHGSILSRYSPSPTLTIHLNQKC